MNKVELNNNDSGKFGDPRASELGVVEIIVTGTENVRLYENQLESVFQQFETMRKAHAQFEQFMLMVRKDLMSKTIRLKDVKMCESSSKSDKSYAIIQLFMLKQYKLRMIKFETVNQDSIDNICDEHSSGVEVDEVHARS